MRVMKKVHRKKHPEGYGLDERQADFLYEILMKALEVMDTRDQHFMLMVLIREGQTDKDEDIISTSVITSMDREFVHDAMRTWLHKETQ